jgi:hypothetical protein
MAIRESNITTNETLRKRPQVTDCAGSLDPSRSFSRCQGYRHQGVSHSKRAARRHGHFPGHIRETFLAAIEAYQDTGPEENAVQNTSSDQLSRAAHQHRRGVRSGLELRRHHAGDRISFTVRLPE